MSIRKYDTQWLKDQYIKNKKSAVQIAKELGVTSGAIYSAMSTRGIKRRSNSDSHRIESNYPQLWDEEYLKRRYLGDGMTTGEIARELGCHDESVRKALIRLGIPRRKLGTRVIVDELRDGGWLYNQYVRCNKTQAQIAEELDCGETVVNKWVKLHKISKPTRWSGNDFKESTSQRNSLKYSSWRKSVIARDGRCTRCGVTKRLQAHHIESFAHNKDLRFNIDNGVTLCQNCHRKEHSSRRLTAKTKTG
jgi:5-methylcytosine-specific restriction endonuclease McrA